MVTHFHITQFAVGRIIMIFNVLQLRWVYNRKNILQELTVCLYRTIVGILQIFRPTKEHT